MDSKRYRSPPARCGLGVVVAAAAEPTAADRAGRLSCARGVWAGLALARTAALMAGLALAGCRHWADQASGEVSDSTFVASMADLRRAVQPGGVESARDSAGRAAVRDSILAKHGVTAATLERAARALAQNPNHAADVARAIDHKVELAAAAAPPVQPSPPAPTQPATPATQQGASPAPVPPPTNQPARPHGPAKSVPPSAGSASRA
jgi:hypothetical protein